jgi:phage replication initiation protein
MTVTWLPDPDEHIPATVHSLLVSVIGNVQGHSAPGMFGYEQGVRFFVDLAGTPHHIGRVDFGGNHHKGRARLDLFGSACGVVRDWLAIRQWIGQQFSASLTRVDLAVDCLLGEYTVDHAVRWYKKGLFKSGGRNPRHSLVGDWLNPVNGRTIEVGRREHGKMCRVYEKGRQLGDAASMWTRFEVEVRNHERDLPLDILTSPDKYFVGAYICLQRVLAGAGERIACRKREGEIALDRLTLHARSSYGQLIQVLRLKLTAAEVLDALQRPGIPGRLSKSSLAEFTTAESPAAFLKANHEAQRHRL